MDSNEIRQRFLSYFKSKEHAIIPSASLVPANDPSVLFNTAGMQPLIPYLLGEAHPLGARLANVQKCVRTQDIEEVGDNTHDTFFEMMGNWSLGDYFKKEAIEWSYEFLTSKEVGLGLDPRRLYVTCFEGDENAPRDDESAQIWQSIFEKNGVLGERIYFLSAKSNWWSVGENGPCGPDTEMFYDTTGILTNGLTKEEYLKADEEQRIVEIWNDVFMEFLKKDGKVVGKLAKRNVDTGSGLERVVMVVQGKNNIFDTDLFSGAISILNSISPKGDERAKRIVADHVRTAVFMIADGVTPSNTDRGYILRRLIRRAVRFADTLGFTQGKDAFQSDLSKIADQFIQQYKATYPELEKQANVIFKEIEGEEQKFRETLSRGLKEFEKGTDAFTLFTTYGFPIELTEELAKEKGLVVNREDFDQKMKGHQDLSRSSSEGMFKGGLANHNEKTIALHSAHHLLLSALQEVLGKDVKQRGSNITEDRLRMDFSFDRKMTDEEKKRVEEIVNTHIKSDLPVVRREMPRIEAETLGAEMEFGAKYPDVVSIYFIEDKDGNAISKEFCGGPHVERTGILGTFVIQKEEASSAGVRRIKAVLK